MISDIFSDTYYLLKTFAEILTSSLICSGALLINTTFYKKFSKHNNKILCGNKLHTYITYLLSTSTYYINKYVVVRVSSF